MTLLEPTELVLSGGWTGLLRIFVYGVVAYGALVVMLRVTGKRTLGKMNAFDLVVTVALGSTFASVLLDAAIPLLDGLAAMAMLILLQFAVTWVSVRSPVARRIVKAEATIVAEDGQCLEKAMRSQRITRDEVEAALRSAGFDTLEDVRFVVLETNGALSVVHRSPPMRGGSQAMPFVSRADEAMKQGAPDRPGGKPDEAAGWRDER